MFLVYLLFASVYYAHATSWKNIDAHSKHPTGLQVNHGESIEIKVIDNKKSGVIDLVHTLVSTRNPNLRNTFCYDTTATKSIVVNNREDILSFDLEYCRVPNTTTTTNFKVKNTVLTINYIASTGIEVLVDGKDFMKTIFAKTPLSIRKQCTEVWAPNSNIQDVTIDTEVGIAYQIVKGCPTNFRLLNIENPKPIYNVGDNITISCKRRKHQLFNTETYEYISINNATLRCREVDSVRNFFPSFTCIRKIKNVNMKPSLWNSYNPKDSNSSRTLVNHDDTQIFELNLEMEKNRSPRSLGPSVPRSNNSEGNVSVLIEDAGFITLEFLDLQTLRYEIEECANDSISFSAGGSNLYIGIELVPETAIYLFINGKRIKTVNFVDVDHEFVQNCTQRWANPGVETSIQGSDFNVTFRTVDLNGAVCTLMLDDVILSPQKDYYDIGENVTIQCKSEFLPNQTVLECRGNVSEGYAAFNTDNFECLENNNTCTPTDVKNGTLLPATTSGQYSVGQSVSLRCEEGSRPVAQAFICQKQNNGEYSFGKKPECIFIGNDENMDNGDGDKNNDDNDDNKNEDDKKDKDFPFPSGVSVLASTLVLNSAAAFLFM